MASDTSSGMQDKLELPHSNQDAMGNVPDDGTAASHCEAGPSQPRPLQRRGGGMGLMGHAQFLTECPRQHPDQLQSGHQDTDSRGLQDHSHKGKKPMQPQTKPQTLISSNTVSTYHPSVGPSSSSHLLPDLASSVRHALYDTPSKAAAALVRSPGETPADKLLPGIGDVYSPSGRGFDAFETPTVDDAVFSDDATGQSGLQAEDFGLRSELAGMGTSRAVNPGTAAVFKTPTLPDLTPLTTTMLRGAGHSGMLLAESDYFNLGTSPGSAMLPASLGARTALTDNIMPFMASPAPALQLSQSVAAATGSEQQGWQPQQQVNKQQLPEDHEQQQLMMELDGPDQRQQQQQQDNDDQQHIEELDEDQQQQAENEQQDVEEPGGEQQQLNEQQQQDEQQQHQAARKTKRADKVKLHKWTPDEKKKAEEKQAAKQHRPEDPLAAVSDSRLESALTSQAEQQLGRPGTGNAAASTAAASTAAASSSAAVTEEAAVDASAGDALAGLEDNDDTVDGSYCPTNNDGLPLNVKHISGFVCEIKNRQSDHQQKQQKQPQQQQQQPPPIAVYMGEFNGLQQMRLVKLLAVEEKDGETCDKAGHATKVVSGYVAVGARSISKVEDMLAASKHSPFVTLQRQPAILSSKETFPGAWRGRLLKKNGLCLLEIKVVFSVAPLTIEVAGRSQTILLQCDHDDKKALEKAPSREAWMTAENPEVAQQYRQFAFQAALAATVRSVLEGHEQLPKVLQLFKIEPATLKPDLMTVSFRSALAIATEKMAEVGMQKTAATDQCGTDAQSCDGATKPC